MSYDPSVRQSGAPPYGPPGWGPPPKKRNGWLIALAVVGGGVVLLCGLGVVLLIAGGIAVNDTAKRLDAQANAVSSLTSVGAGGGAPGTAAPRGGSNLPANDVQITKCAMADNPLEGPEATLRFTNHSSKPSSYLVEVAFTSKDGATRYDTGSAAVNRLAPGQAQIERAPSLKGELRTQLATTGFSCAVLSVNRFATP